MKHMEEFMMQSRCKIIHKGFKILSVYDVLARNNLILVTPIITKTANLGSMIYPY